MTNILHIPQTMIRMIALQATHTFHRLVTAQLNQSPPWMYSQAISQTAHKALRNTILKMVMKNLTILPLIDPAQVCNPLYSHVPHYHYTCS